MNKALIVKLMAMIVMLSACETSGLPGFDLGSQAENGTVIIGMAGKDKTKFSVVVASLNEDGSVSSRGGRPVEHTGGKEKGFYAVSLKPGTYIFRSVNWGNRLSKYVVCLNQETYAFRVRTGETLYAGDIAFDRASFGYGAATFTGMSDRAGVAGQLAGNPLVTGPMMDAQLRPATFAMARNRLNGNELCGSGSF